MPETCDHGFRWTDKTARCGLPPHAGQHTGHLNGPGIPLDTVVMSWETVDRRDFVGDDPGQCDVEAPAERDDAAWSDVDAGPGSRCILPLGHPGRHAS